MFILFGLFGNSEKLTVWKLQRNNFPLDSFLFFRFLYMTFKHAISVFDFPLACSCRKCLIRLLTGRFAVSRASIQVDSGEGQVKGFALRWRNIHTICFYRSRSYDYTLNMIKFLSAVFPA